VLKKVGPDFRKNRETPAQDLEKKPKITIFGPFFYPILGHISATGQNFETKNTRQMYFMGLNVVRKFHNDSFMPAQVMA
jgi:hypothetical protein